MSELREVVDVAPIYQVVYGEEDNYVILGSRSRIPVGLRLYLEDGEIFEMYYVPPEVIEALEMIKRGENPPKRQSLFSLLAFHDEFRDMIDKSLDRIVIDEFDEETEVYTATAHFEVDGVRLTVKMIPSHAVYLALVAGKPIYVSEDLIELSNNMQDKEDDEDDGGVV